MTSVLDTSAKSVIEFRVMDNKDTGNQRKTRKVVRFADVLKELREAKRLSQRALAERAGLTPLRISRLENGHIDPRLRELANLAEELSVNLDRLVFGDDPVRRGRLEGLFEELRRRGDAATLRVVERMLEGILGPWTTVSGEPLRPPFQGEGRGSWR
jgi:transcriptional regulator with XRE-family HTH domain